MSNLTVTGNLVAQPEVRVSPSGKTFTTFTVVENSQYRNDAGEWVDNPPTFWPVIVWGEYWGKHLAESLRKGDRVVVNGDTRTNTWQDKDTGDNRSRVEVTAREVGASLKFASAMLSRRTRQDAPPVEGFAPVAAHAAADPF